MEEKVIPLKTSNMTYNKTEHSLVNGRSMDCSITATQTCKLTTYFQISTTQTQLNGMEVSSSEQPQYLFNIGGKTQVYTGHSTDTIITIIRKILKVPTEKIHVSLSVSCDGDIIDTTQKLKEFSSGCTFTCKFLGRGGKNTSRKKREEKKSHRTKSRSRSRSRS